MQIRLLNAATVRELLPMTECVGLMRRAFEMVSTGETVQPIRQALRQPDGRGLLSLMPGYIATPDWLGVKIVTVFPSNFGSAFGSHQGMVLLFDTTNGAPVAILDGREITAIRTAAATAAATDVLSSAKARSLGVLGYGEQAANHIEALLQIRPFETVLVWGRDFSRANHFAEEMEDRFGLTVNAVEQAQQAATCDVVCTTTAAPEPILFADWLKPGQHVNLVGSSIPTTSEVDEELLGLGRLFVDFRESALALAGDFNRAKAKGLINDTHIVGCIGDVMLGAVPARETETDITIFKSLGMASQDLVASDFVLSAANQRGIGQLVEW